jgi:hypothetical protein
MPVKVSWFDSERTTLIYEFYGKWTWDELYPVFGAAQDMANSVDYDVYVLAIPRDDAARHHIPPSILAHFPTLARRISPNTVLDVIVLQGALSFWFNLYQSIKSMYPFLTQRFAIATSEEEALQLIKDHKARNALASSS